jgi:hypothetical protein
LRKRRRQSLKVAHVLAVSAVLGLVAVQYCAARPSAAPPHPPAAKAPVARAVAKPVPSASVVSASARRGSIGGPAATGKGTINGTVVRQRH